MTEATKVAREAYADAIREVNEKFRNSTVVGCEMPNGKIVYRVWGSVPEVKASMVIGKAKFTYVGQIKLEPDKDAVPTLEEVDMSKVKYEGIKLTEKGRKDFEQRRKTRYKK